MNKEQQDLNWKCLPKETREELRKIYFHYSNTPNRTLVCEMENLFGKHNLTSDTEPEEMLIVERQSIIDSYAVAKRRSWDYKDADLYRAMDKENGKLFILESLFGDKCLPDKEVDLDKLKFKIGDKVRIRENVFNDYYCGTIATIVEQGECARGYGWILDIREYCVFLESELELYTEEDDINETLYEKDGISLENEAKIEEMKEKQNKIILPGDLIEIKGKEQSLKAVVTELTDNKYVKVQPIGLTCSIYVEKAILKRDNPELYGE